MYNFMIVNMYLQIFALFCCIALATATTIDNDCIEGSSYLYQGKHQYTSTGIKCQRWDRVYPHRPRHIPADGGHHNYCRNPDKDAHGTWCYTVDPNIKWGYCEIPKCVDDSTIIWTSFNPNTNESNFERIAADLEYVNLNNMDKNELGLLQEDRKFGYSSQSYIKTVEADFKNKQLYFTDAQQNFFGILDMETKEKKDFFHGMARNVEAITFDPISGNVYWTDSEMKWVMVADPELKSYAPVYKATPHTPKALEVHASRRLLVFSTYWKNTSKDFGATITVTDLAGQNERVILKYPDVVDVRGLTIDYNEDRIYWTDNLGYASKVCSCRLDGSEVTQHYFKDRSEFRDIAVFSDYIYVTDTSPRLNFFREIYYQVYVITKRSDQVSAYDEWERPYGVSVYKEKDGNGIPTGPGECTEECDGICLPRIGAPSACVCPLGLKRHPKTKACVEKILSDDYLLVVDKDQGKMFQFSLKTGNSYTEASIGDASRIVSAAVNPASQFCYFSDSKERYLHRGILGGETYTNIADSYALNIDVDPHTQNVFYSTKNQIYLSTHDGRIQRMIVDSVPDSDIKSFALDLKYKMIYWTDTTSQRGKGKVMRSRFDGSKREVVMDNLESPHGIAVDYDENVLYVMESERAMLYSAALSKLKKISSTSGNNTSFQTTDLFPSVSHRRFHFTQMKIHMGKIFMIDEMQHKLVKINPSKGASSLKFFGPNKFFQASSLSLYRKSSQEKYLKTHKNPCKRLPCSSLCIALSQKLAKCVGKRLPWKSS